jgi:hypothetical protein
MIHFEIEDKFYAFPERFQELTINKFQQVTNIKNTDEIDSMIKIISALSEIPTKVIEDLPYTEFIKLTKHCNFIFGDNNEKPSFELNIKGIDYIMISDITKITTSEFLDLDTYLKDTENSIPNLHYILAILYRPKIDGKIEKYNEETLDDRAQLFKYNMTCDYALSALLFSLALGQTCLSYIQDSSNQVLEN